MEYLILKTSENKSCTISVRCTEQEKQELIELSHKDNMNLSNYIIHVCLASSVNHSKHNEVLFKIYTLVNQYDNQQISTKKFAKKIWKVVKEYAHD